MFKDNHLTFLEKNLRVFLDHGGASEICAAVNGGLAAFEGPLGGDVDISDDGFLFFDIIKSAVCATKDNSTLLQKPSFSKKN